VFSVHEGHLTSNSPLL